MFVFSNFRRLTAVLVVGTCVWIFQPVSGAEPTQTPEQRQQEIEQLIEQLASENLEPKTITDASGDRTTQFPPDYREKQKKVTNSAAKLREFGIEAVPSLIEHLDDARYSYSEAALNDRDRIFYRRSVGGHCSEIVERIVCHYDSWGNPLNGFGPTARSSYPGLATKRAAQEWWARNKDKPLWQLQADILQWAIDLELKTKQNDKWNAEESKKAVEANRKKLDELLKTKKPL